MLRSFFLLERDKLIGCNLFPPLIGVNLPIIYYLVSEVIFSLFFSFYPLSLSTSSSHPPPPLRQNLILNLLCSSDWPFKLLILLPPASLHIGYRRVYLANILFLIANLLTFIVFYCSRRVFLNYTSLLTLVLFLSCSWWHHSLELRSQPKVRVLHMMLTEIPVHIPEVLGIFFSKLKTLPCWLIKAV